MYFQRTHLLVAVIIGIIAVLSGHYLYKNDGRISGLLSSIQNPIGNIISGRYNDSLYTRGKMHYFTMDSGMKSCWNRTIKPLLQLSCPDLDSESDLELELTFVLTSCFCESIGHAKLDCQEDRQHREDKLTYHAAAELILCAQGKCYNEFNHDGFDTIYKRMPDLCYFYEYEAHHHDPKMKPFLSDDHLALLLKEVKGSPGTNWPALPSLLKLVSSEIEARKSSLKRRMSEHWTEFCLAFENFKYWIQDSFDGLIEIFWDYYYYFFPPS